MKYHETLFRETVRQRMLFRQILLPYNRSTVVSMYPPRLAGDGNNIFYTR
ncbi:MAG: hypothetical protein OYL97_08200 [Candidatus Poribacteria bacterium]|nr:hypothetical protein [Candidatus Poribacteria bacterium]